MSSREKTIHADWIEHDGKGMPVDGETLVQFRNAIGEELLGKAHNLEWVHGLDTDIIAYRVYRRARSTPSDSEGGAE
jgi:hypothetical protein